MTPLTTRARELAARERKLYDQRTIPAVLEELADEVERLTAVEAEHTELSNLFDMQFDADARAVKEWRDNNPSNDLVWPDSARLAVWALEQMSSAMAEADKLRAEAANIAAQRDEAEKRAEVAEERLRAKEADLAAAREECREAVMQALASMGQAQEAYEAQLAAEREAATLRDRLARMEGAATKIRELIKYDLNPKSCEITASEDGEFVVYDHVSAALTDGGSNGRG